MNSALVVDQLSVSYGKSPALWDISFNIPTGKLVGIVGPNGAGKSTLIKAILELVPKMSGKVTMIGLPFHRIRQQIAYIPQRGEVEWDFPITVEDLVLMGCYGKLGLFLRPGNAERKKAQSCLEMVGLQGLGKRQISQLSGGQQQRAFLARALMQQPQIYFLDEPFSGVDIASETAMMELLRLLRDEGKTIFIVHHNLSHVQNYFDWLLLLNMRLVASGSVAECFNPQTIQEAYGNSYLLAEDLFKLSKSRQAGL